MKASVSLFQSQEYKYDSPENNVPDELFEYALETSKDQETRILNKPDGVYLILYSETGPFINKMNNNWLPVKIYCLQSYKSGGICMTEIEKYQENQASGTTSP